MVNQHQKTRQVWYDTDETEMYAVIGVLMYAGVHRNWVEELADL